MNRSFSGLLLTIFGLFLMASVCHGQKESISFELNGRTSNAAIVNDKPFNTTNPFSRFVGNWTLRDDKWTQNWGDGTDTIEIRNHHTVTRVLNTENSLLSIIDGPEPNGHIFWSYNPVDHTVHHSSSFGTSRIGQGEGQVDSCGNVSLKIAFEGEAEGTYRLYEYIWVDDDEYTMKSVQFDENDTPTGKFYEGNFIRVHSELPDESRVRQEILENGEIIRTAFARGDIELIQSLHHPDVVKALGYQDVKTGRKEVMNGIRETLGSYTLEFVENDVESLFIEGNTVIEQSRFSIKGTSKSGEESFLFSGRTMVTYIRYNESPTGWATIREIIQPAT